MEATRRLPITSQNISLGEVDSCTLANASRPPEAAVGGPRVRHLLRFHERFELCSRRFGSPVADASVRRRSRQCRRQRHRSPGELQRHVHDATARRAPHHIYGDPGVTINTANGTTQDGIDLEGADFVTIDGFKVVGWGVQAFVAWSIKARLFATTIATRTPSGAYSRIQRKHLDREQRHHAFCATARVY